jgi:hypothetical protein
MGNAAISCDVQAADDLACVMCSTLKDGIKMKKVCVQMLVPSNRRNSDVRTLPRYQCYRMARNSRLIAPKPLQRKGVRKIQFLKLGRGVP